MSSTRSSGTSDFGDGPLSWAAKAFHAIDETADPELADHLRTLAARFTRATGGRS